MLSKTQRRIWMIAWNMWLNRNNTLHKEKLSIHPANIKNLNREIEFEFEQGIQELPTNQQYLFKSSKEELIAKPTHNKLKWIYTVWSARELINESYLYKEQEHTRNEATIHKYERWKKSIT